MGRLLVLVAGESLMDLFWAIATSPFALGADALLLAAAVVVGWLPFGRYMPIIAPYVKAARLVAVLLALLIAFLFDYRAADERAEMAALRATIAAQRADLNAAERARDDANKRATLIEKDANAQRKADDDYIASLPPAAAGCGFEPFPGSVRKDGAGAGAGVPRPAAAPGSSDDGPAAAGAGSDVPVSVVRRRWLPWQRS